MKQENAQASSKPSNPGIVNGATPADGTNTFYQGQKLTLDVSTAYLQSNGYTDVKFQLAMNDDFTQLDGTKAGLIVHPGQIADQPVTAANEYKLDAVVYGTSSTTDLTFTRWNVEVTGHIPTLTLNGSKIGGGTNDYGYGTSPIWIGPMFGTVQIPDNITAFDPGKALKVSAYQVNDATRKPITAATFSGYVTAQTGDLTNFDFWDENQNKLTKIQVGGVDTYAWVDSDATGKFTFYITCNKTSGMYSDTLNLTVGNMPQPIALIVAGDPTILGSSSMLPAPRPTYMDGSDLILSDNDTLVSIDIPKPPTPDPFQAGDTLVLVVNGKPQWSASQSLPLNGTTLPFPHFFTVAVSDLNVSQTGALNTIAYINVSGNDATLSSEFAFNAFGSGQTNPNPQPPVKKYLQPEIVGNPGYLEILYEDVADGLTVKIDWSGSNWAPNLADVLKLTIQFNAWSYWDGSSNTTAPVIPFDPVAALDLTNKYITKTIPYGVFAGIVEDPGTGTPSQLFMQYYVPAGGTNQAGWSWPTPWIDIDTVPPGGL